MASTDFRQKLYRAFPTTTEREVEDAIQFLGRSLHRNVAESYLDVLIEHPKEMLGDVSSGMFVESVQKSFHECLRQVCNLEYKALVNKMESDSENPVSIYKDDGDIKSFEEIVNELTE